MNRIKKEELEEAFFGLLKELDPRTQARPYPARMFAKKLTEFTEVWAENFPENPNRIEQLEQEILEWIARDP